VYPPVPSTRATTISVRPSLIPIAGSRASTIPQSSIGWAPGRDGLQQQDVLLVSDTPFCVGRVLIDPNPAQPGRQHVTGRDANKEGRSHDALIAERTDVLAFLSQHTGLSWR
jgi:hypothetical protein